MELLKSQLNPIFNIPRRRLKEMIQRGRVVRLLRGPWVEFQNLLTAYNMYNPSVRVAEPFFQPWLAPVHRWHSQIHARTHTHTHKIN